jgi:AcrR family transcriptional regulator
MNEGGALSASLLRLPALAQGLPPAPPEALDPYLDAAAACFARHGVSRTTVPDIAREIGVSRTTVYRQVGTVEHLARLLLAREVHRILVNLPAALEGATGPDTVVRLVAAVIEFARSHPVLVKVLTDEPELVGGVLVEDLTDLVARVSAMATPLLADAMASGLVARRDPEVVADFLVRITVTLVLAPPAVSVERFLAEVVRPVLAPDERA